MATTFKVCRDLAHALALHEAGLLTVDHDCGTPRINPEYLPATAIFPNADTLTDYYNGRGGWIASDFGYLEED